MPSPNKKIILVVLAFAASNYYSYDLGYGDGVRDIIKEIIELREEIRLKGIDPAVKGVTT